MLANEAADVKREHLMRQKGFLPQEQHPDQLKRRETKEDLEAKRRHLEIEASLKLYDFSKPDDLYATVGDIWGGNTIF